MASKITPRTIADFKGAHDPDVIVPRKIRAALEQIAKVGAEHYEYEGDLIKLAGISQGQNHQVPRAVRCARGRNPRPLTVRA